MKSVRWAVLGGILLVGLSPRVAHAGDATVSVGDPDGFAEPPPRSEPVVVRNDRNDPDDRERFEDPSVAESPEPYRSPFRLNVGPVGVTSGRGLGLGLGVAADFGTGTVGARIAGAWTRGETANADQESQSELGTGLGQYTGELTLDLHKKGPVHPVFGVGFGLAHVANAQGGGNAGIGIARLGVEYSLGLSDADVRLGAGVTGVLA
ncbi:MAG: hypothetical protein ACRELY_25760, partial [Polyangiaceae bacterium]